MTGLGRRYLLAVPLAVSACGGGDDDSTGDFPPLRYADLPPIQLNVATIEVQQYFIPSGIPPDVSGQDPANPIETLRTMAKDRLQAYGTANKAVFAINNAALVQTNDVLRGDMAVSLTIYDNDGTQLGFAEAHVSQTHTGRVRDLRATLYEMTKSMMFDVSARSMNIEFEYQVRRNLKAWLTSTAAPDTAVQQDPLDQPENK